MAQPSRVRLLPSQIRSPAVPPHSLALPPLRSSLPERNYPRSKIMRPQQTLPGYGPSPIAVSIGQTTSSASRPPAHGRPPSLTPPPNPYNAAEYWERPENGRGRETLEKRQASRLAGPSPISAARGPARVGPTRHETRGCWSSHLLLLPLRAAQGHARDRPTGRGEEGEGDRVRPSPSVLKDPVPPSPGAGAVVPFVSSPSRLAPFPRRCRRPDASSRRP